VRKADNLPPSCAVVTKSGNLNFLEPSGHVQACNGTAFIITKNNILCCEVGEVCIRCKKISVYDVLVLQKHAWSCKFQAELQN